MHDGPMTTLGSGPLLPVETMRAMIEAGERLVVLDVRYRMGGPSGLEEYLAGHIPGASYVDLEKALADQPDGGGRHPLPDRERFGDAMRAAGVSQGVPVVVYDDWGGRAAARCWWLLRHHGHDLVRVLDGGWSSWRSAGGAVDTHRHLPEPGDYVAEHGRLPTLRAEEVLEFEGVLVDAREPARFRGETEPVDPVAGHIPGAVNRPTSANLRDDGTFRPAEELAETYGFGSAQVAAYCGSGVTACHDLVAMATVGIEGALYPGSWSEWVADPSHPVATGDTHGAAAPTDVPTSARP